MNTKESIDELILLTYDAIYDQELDMIDWTSVKTLYRHCGALEGLLISLGVFNIAQPFDYKTVEVERGLIWKRKISVRESYPEMIVRNTREYLKKIGKIS